MTRAQLKQAAKDQLRGNWGWAICLTIFAWLVNAVIMDLNRWIWTGKDFTYTVLRFNKDNLIQGYKPAYNLSEIIVGLITGLILWGVSYTLLKQARWRLGILVYLALIAMVALKTVCLLCL